MTQSLTLPQSVTPPLPIQFRHLKTSRQFNAQGQLLQRYWFAWYERTHPGPLSVRFSFEDATGKELRFTRLNLPRLKRTGQLPDGTPTYQGTSWICIDEPITYQPLQVRIYVVTGLLRKSASVLLPLAKESDELWLMQAMTAADLAPAS